MSRYDDLPSTPPSSKLALGATGGRSPCVAGLFPRYCICSPRKPDLKVEKQPFAPPSGACRSSAVWAVAAHPTDVGTPRTGRLTKPLAWVAAHGILGNGHPYLTPAQRQGTASGAGPTRPTSRCGAGSRTPSSRVFRQSMSKRGATPRRMRDKHPGPGRVFAQVSLPAPQTTA